MNRVELAGRLVRDVELQKTSSGISIAYFDVACKKHSKEGGTDFIHCQAWRRSAEYLAQYGKKGGIVSVEGRLQNNNYTKSDGASVSTTGVVADNVELFGRDSHSSLVPQSEVSEDDLSY